MILYYRRLGILVVFVSIPSSFTFSNLLQYLLLIVQPITHHFVDLLQDAELHQTKQKMSELLKLNIQ